MKTPYGLYFVAALLFFADIGAVIFALVWHALKGGSA